MNILPWLSHHSNRHPNQPTANLAEVLPGRQATVVGFAPNLAPERRLQLQAYGLTDGARIRVLQHAPVTVVEIDHLELALETHMARLVLTSAPE